MDKRLKRPPSFVGEVFGALRKQKKLWLIPLLLIIFGIVGLMLAAGTAGPLTPFLYPLF